MKVSSRNSVAKGCDFLRTTVIRSSLIVPGPRSAGTDFWKQRRQPTLGNCEIRRTWTEAKWSVTTYTASHVGNVPYYKLKHF